MDSETETGQSGRHQLIYSNAGDLSYQCNVIDGLCVWAQGAEPDRPTKTLQQIEPVEVNRESYLTHLYGRAPYEGVRRTLKKSPYLRFSSPGSPISRKPRPQIVENIRGQRVVLHCNDPFQSSCPVRAEYDELRRITFCFLS